MTARATSTITAVLVDDEQLAREELSYLLKEFPDVELLASGRNGLEAIKLIENFEPDVVFLDVQMPGLDGFGVIQKLRQTDVPLPHFILATAYDQYAIEAFRWEALDYLLKPIEKERLALAVERAAKAVAEKAKPQPAELAGPKPALHRGRPGSDLRDDRRWVDHGCCVERRGRIELPDHRGAAVEPGSGCFLARAPVVSGEHQPDQGSDSVVQVELPAQDGRQEADRDSSEPGADQAAAGVAEAVVGSWEGEMQSKAVTVDAYLRSLPVDRRRAISAVRE